MRTRSAIVNDVHYCAVSCGVQCHFVCPLFSSFVRLGVWFCSPYLPYWRIAPCPAKLPAPCTRFSTRKQTAYLCRAFCARDSRMDAGFCVPLQAKVNGSATSIYVYVCHVSLAVYDTEGCAEFRCVRRTHLFERYGPIGQVAQSCCQKVDASCDIKPFPEIVSKYLDTLN